MPDTGQNSSAQTGSNAGHAASQLHALLASLDDWWAMGGVSEFPADDPQDWFNPPPDLTLEPAVKTLETSGSERGSSLSESNPDRRSTAPPASTPALPEMPDLPETAADFLDMWMNHPALDPPGALGERIAPRGAMPAQIMVITAEPERDDMNRLLTGKSGALLDNMLKAVGLQPDSLYFASIFPRHIAHRRAVRPLLPYFYKLLDRHIALAKPEKLILLGDLPNMALLQNALSQNLQKIHFINHVSGELSAMASPHPRTLLRQPALKAQAWKSWQLLLRGVALCVNRRLWPVSLQHFF